MKTSTFKMASPALAFALLFLLSATPGFAQNFQRAFGTDLDNAFSKVIRSDTNYYVLGYDEPSDGALPQATVTRLDPAGQHQWTLRLDIASVWNDAVLTPSGELLVVGATLPADPSSQSLMGLVTPLGAFTWVRRYNIPDLDAFTRIVRSPAPETASFPYYVLGTERDGLTSKDDVFLLNVDKNGVFNWKKLFDSTADDDFARDLEVLPNGDLLLTGDYATLGVIVRTDNTGALVGAAAPEGIEFSFADVTPASSGGFYAVGATSPNTAAHLMKFDADLLNVWGVIFPQLDDVGQVWEAPGGGIYVTGTWTSGGLSRAALLKLTDGGGGPTLDWIRYLQDNETAFDGGASVFLPPDQIGFADGRTRPDGFGQHCAFVSVSDLELASCMTVADTAVLEPSSLLFFGPLLPDLIFDGAPQGTDLPGSSALNWQQADVCSAAGPQLFCGDIAVFVEPDQDGRAVGYNGITAEGDGVALDFLPAEGSIFPIGVTAVVATATDASGGTASCSFTVTVEKMPFDSVQPPANFSQYGVFDRVRDRFGNPYRLEDLQVPADSADLANRMPPGAICGYFNLYFEPGCGMDGSSVAETDRRNLICQLFTDLSQFITPANSTVRVNIWVRNIANVPGVPNPMTSGILGVGSSFYVMPNGAPALGGIVEGEIWRTINGGVDSYTNVASPLVASGGNGFYHGMVAFNFVNTIINWHTDLSTMTATGLYDLYSVALHEAVHALGFASLIGPTGVSNFGPVFPKYFSRYDLYLQSPANQPLITDGGACGTMYDYQFNPVVPTGVLEPDPNNCIFNQTTCAAAIKFAGSVGQKAYTPNCFEPGSSLSHLEDLCHVPLPYPNDEYYVMSNANGTGPVFMKRFLKPEEKQVLCDIGYRTAGNYGNAGQFTQTTYPGGGCPGPVVAGVNDGLTPGGNFAYSTNVSGQITIGNVLANDFMATSFECLQVVFGSGALNASAGTSFIYFAPANPETALLRYVPVSAAGKRGNITYVFIRVNGTGCAPSICGGLGDPGFEQAANCAAIANWLNMPAAGKTYCWEPLTSSPDLYARTNCSISSGYLINSSPLIAPNTWDASLSNRYYLGLWGSLSTTQEDFESIQATLATPITAGTYTIGMWVQMSQQHPNPGDGAILIAGSPSTLPHTGLLAFTPVLSNPAVVQLVPPSDLPVVDNYLWNYVTATFTYTGATPLYNLILSNYSGTTPFPLLRYILVDDVTLTPQTSLPTFAPPTPLCVTGPAVSLNATGSPPGGVFTGPGVTGSYNFNPGIAGIGTHVVTYTVTDFNGCTHSATAAIQVDPPPAAVFTPPAQPICLAYASFPLNPLATPAGGAFSGPGVVNNGSGNYDFDPILAGVGIHVVTYTVTGGLCPTTGTAVFQVDRCDACEVSNLCLAFDGVDDYVSAPNPLNTPALQNNFTVACWFRDDRTTGAANNLYRLFGLGWNQRFELGDQNGFLTFYNNTSGLVISNTTIRNTGWRHVAAVHSGGTVNVYLDGVLVLTVPNVTVSGTPVVFNIGNWGGFVSPAPRFHQGRMDEFKIWGAALTPAQIQEEMGCGSDPNNTSLLAYFPFDQNIAGGNNAGQTVANNVGTAGGNGALIAFALNGTLSNWVDRGRDLLPDCNVGYFDWLEGSPDRDIPGRTKVYDADIFTAGVENFTGTVNFPTFTRRRSDGSIVWRCIIDQPGVINDFIRTDGGCYLLVGHLNNFTGDNYSFIAQIDHLGALIWLDGYNVGERESFTRIIRSDNPDDPLFPYVGCGIRKANAFTNRDDIVLFTLNGRGTINWMQHIGDANTDDEFRFDLMNYAGGYLLAGFYVNSGAASPVLFRTNNFGIQSPLSTQYQAGLVFLDVEPAATGTDLIVAGQSTSGDAILARVDATGGQVWARRFPALTTFRKVVVRPNGDIFAVGQRDAIGQYRNVIVKVRDLPGGPSMVWQKHAELTWLSENNWTPADLVWYGGGMYFFTDGRIGHSKGWGNEDIGAVMYELDLPNDVCPITKETPVSANFTLLPSAMPALANVGFVSSPQTINAWTQFTLNRDTLCSDECNCIFAYLGFRRTYPGFPPWGVPVAGCGLGPVALPTCPAPSAPIKFSGLLQCQGPCTFTSLNWTLKDPLNNPVASGSSTTPAFTLYITLAMVQIPGTYTIELTGQCGTKVCTCTVKFTLPPCPPACDCLQPAFSNAVNAGFSWLQLPNCQYQFTPKYLTGCDGVTWTSTPLGGTTTTFATSNGNQTVSQGFSNGQYSICMTVTRTQSNGLTCTASRCQTFNFICTLLAEPPDGLARPESPCDASIVQNPGFVSGAEAGGLADVGTVGSWDESGGNPELATEPGFLDTNLVRLRGNGGFADLIYQDSLPLTPWDSVEFSLALRPIQPLLWPGTELIVRLSAARQDSLWCNDENTCLEVMRLPLPALDSTIWLLGGGFATVKTEALPFLTIHVENPLLVDDVGLQSVVDLDNVCLSVHDLVSAQEPGQAEPLDVRLFPNPTTGFLNVRLNRPLAGDARLRLFDSRGGLIRENGLGKGQIAHVLDLNALPAGLYFMEIRADGGEIWWGKVVKQ